MKQYLYSLLFIFILASCGSSRYAKTETQEDKILLSAIKKVEKNPSDTSSQHGLMEMYNDAATQHLNNIDLYKTLNDESKWNKILQEYNALERLNKTVNSSKIASRFIKPISFTAEIQVTRNEAAQDFYNKGLDYLQNNDKQSARHAYTLFNQTAEMVPNFKDVRRQLSIAKEQSTLNIVVNPIRDESRYYSGLGWNRFGNSFNNDYLQRNLVRDLGGDYSGNSFARYFTDMDARRSNVNIDWVVDLTWLDLDIPRPYSRQYNRNVSQQIKVGTDTSGKAVYETVTGTLYITQQYFTARGELESRVTDAHTGNNVNLNRYSSTVDWKQEYATYRGDSRALSNQDRAILNNQTIREPRQEDILNELFGKIYPQVKNGLYNLTR
ncbi:MAG: hypothetical protein ABIW47_16270 [Ginsengibacter sp.]|jgi:hypothetical protein